jgi:hypothetical protein
MAGQQTLLQFLGRGQKRKRGAEEEEEAGTTDAQVPEQPAVASSAAKEPRQYNYR